MNEGKNLREAVDAVAGEALDEAMGMAFGADNGDQRPDFDETPQLIGRYKLLEKIGEGGFGVVYMAEQQEPIRRQVALKIIKLGMDTKQVVARFEAERQALAMMDHENIASVFDAGATETGRPYFVMELVRGVPITEYCDRNKLNTTERLRAFVAVCKAVQHAHQKGIIHRDLKPNNVMVTLRGGTPVPKVIDFGIAKATAMRLTEKTIFTRYGQFIGTPAYMSPEQVEMSELDVDTRSDIYSLGVLLYELLTGTTPLERDRLKRASHSEIQRMICEQDPARPSSRLSRSGEALATISAQRSTQPKKLEQLMRGELDWIVMKSLEKDRTRRYDTANGLAADVLRYLNQEPVEASPTSASYKLRKFAGKHRKWIAAASAFTLLLLASSVVSTWLAFVARQAERRATYNEGLATQRLYQQGAATREMRRQRDLANELGGKLSHQLAETDKAAERGRNLLYVAHMNLIQQELRNGNDARVVELLDYHRPADGQRDLRGFEWYYVWQLCHRNLWSWQHYAAIGCVAHSPDGKWVATGSSDGSIQVWDTESGRIVATTQGHGSMVSDIEFSPDGRTIFSGSHDQTVRLWTLESERLNAKGPSLPHSGPVYCLAISPDGTKLASASGIAGQTGELKIWNSLGGDERTLSRQHEAVSTLAFSSDGTKLASGGIKPKFEIWDTYTATLTKTVQTSLTDVLAIAFSPTSDTLALGDSRGAVELWNETTGSRRLGQHSDTVTDLAFSPDGELVASSAADSLIILWDAKSGDKTDALHGHTKPVRSISFSPTGNSLVSAGDDNTVKTWDLAHGQVTANLSAHTAAVGSVAFSPIQDHLLASAGDDGSVRLWDVDRGEVIDTPAPYGGSVRCVAFSPDGKMLAYGGGVYDQPADAVFWDLERQTARRTTRVHTRAVLTLAFSPDGGTLATGGDEGLLALWDVKSGALKTQPQNAGQAVVSLAFSSDGQLLATSSFHHNDITLWNVDNLAERRVLQGHRDWVTSVAFSPDGSMLASGAVDRTVRLWDVASCRQKLELVGHRQQVGALAFSPDGLTLASLGRDDQLRLWDVATGQEKLKLDCQLEMDGAAVAFSPDGRTLAAGNDRFVALHRAATDQDFFLDDAPELPQNQQPPAGKTVKTPLVTLQAGPFSHRHPDITHTTSHWQVRRGDAGYSVPVINRAASSDLTTLRLQPGVLSPNTTYFWRVAYTGSNHLTTSFSAEKSFTSADFAMTAVPFDLTPHLNCDIIKNPGDRQTDSIDTSAGSHLVVEGFDGERADNAQVDGLPRDGQVGLHLLGDYSENNALQIGPDDEDKTPIRVSLPPDQYHFVRFLVVGGNGNTDMPVRFEYADGTSQTEIIRCDDWFHDIAENRYGALRTGLLPIINEMDRFYDGEFRDENEAAIYEVIFPVDPAKQMLALVLETGGDDVQYTDTSLYPRHWRVRFNLLAATGVVLGP